MNQSINYISIYPIINSVLSTFDSEDVTFSEMVEYCSDVMEWLASVEFKENNFEEISIKNYRGELPCNIYQIEGVKDKVTGLPYIESTNVFHEEQEEQSEVIHSYSIKRNYIFTNVKKTEIIVAYKSFMLDDEGFPLIPNDISFREALRYHLLFRIGEKLNLLDRFSDRKLEKIEQNRNWYIGQAQSKAKTPDPEKMAHISNQMSRLIHDTFAHSTFYKHLNKPQI